MKVTGETLRGITLFQDLELDQRRRLADMMQMEKYAPGQFVISTDDTSKDVFFVVSGKVKATLYSLSGRAVSFQELAGGEMFGEFSAIDDDERSTHVVALEESLIARLSNDAFKHAWLNFPSVTERLLLRLIKLLRSHQERMYEFSTLCVKNRIHAELLRLAREVSDGDGEVVIVDPPIHEEIASRIASHREAVTRECKRMESLGLIEWRPGRHVIKDVAALERLVREVKGL
ncbi:MAG: Crp/Fnr family transcriptional regulator [Gammaproteobacteria bacterium]|nr:Crp/Fnr family transcriptional regulator [Gammaproteobacteria bacterium]